VTTGAAARLAAPRHLARDGTQVDGPPKAIFARQATKPVPTGPERQRGTCSASVAAP